MNDPGLDEPIQDGAETMDRYGRSTRNEAEEEQHSAEEEEQAFLEPSRWWFASTAFPLVAGTFGPMASAFSICALVQNWRVKIPPGGVEEHGIDIKDPKWLIIVNAISLAFALLANMSLLLNMARRLSFPIAQPCTIIGWYLASFMLIALVSIASHHLHAPGVQNQALSQAYYYAIIAASLYFIISSLMAVTVYGASKGHYEKEFKLTISQRTLMLQTISFMVYLLAGAAVYSHIEQWQFLDAVYWADCTLLTVGIGDYSPRTHLGRGLLFPFAIGGIVILGLVVGSIRSLVLERGKDKLGARMTEKKRRAVLRRLRDSGKIRLSPISNPYEPAVTSNGQSEKVRRQQEFELMRQIQSKASMERKWVSLLISSSAAMVLWFVGAVVFWKAERNQMWSYFEALYFAYTSLLTIGYGDFYPMSNSGRPFFVFWSLLAVPTLTILISNMGDTIIIGIRDLTISVGEFTVLPGEMGVRQRLRSTISKVIHDEESSVSDEPPPGFSGQATVRNGISETDENQAVERFTTQDEEVELNDIRVARSCGDKLAENEHIYHFLLIREIRNVMGHLNSSPPKQYTYDEWAWFLKLSGEDENSPRSHRTAPIKVHERDENILGTETGYSRREEDGIRDKGKEHRMHKWSWLENRSPLMGEKLEAEWVLERLSDTLERALRKQRDRYTEQGKRVMSEEKYDPPAASGSGKILELRTNDANGS
ncbi:MAG: Potassium channel [Cirrosporium novae-zelandiae]|nr:MAG: Potassium channel [Cirrosporium novae-zelandiae]